MPEPHERTLLRGFARSVRDNAIGEVAIQLIRVAGIIYLARRLGPAEFGVYRALLIVGTIAALASEAGIPEALIQRPNLREEHHATAWWMSLWLAIVAAGLLYLCAPMIAALLLMPPLRAQIRLLCIPILLLTLSTTGNAMIRREFRFGALAIADTLGEIAFLVVAITLLLYYHAPHWSLAGGLAGRYCIQAAAVMIASSFGPRQMPKLSAARELTGFAGAVLSGRMLVTLSSNADYLIIGRVLGETALGYYTFAWDLLRFIPDRLFKIVGRVTLPLFAQMQHDDAALRRRYCDFVRDTARFVLPIMAGLVVAAPQVVTGLYGQKWLPAAPILRVLVIGITMIGLTLPNGSIYLAKGRPATDFYLHSARLILIVVCVGILARFGLMWASIAMTVLEAAVALWGQLIASSLIELDNASLMRAMGPGLRNAVIAACVTAAGCAIASSVEVRPAVALALIAALPAFAMLLVERPTLSRMARSAASG